MNQSMKSIAGVALLSAMVISAQAETIGFEGMVATQYDYEAVRAAEGVAVTSHYGNFAVSVWEAVYLPDNYITSALTAAEVAALPAGSGGYIHPSNGSANIVTQRLVVKHTSGAPFTASSVEIAELVDNINVGQVSIRGYADDNDYIEQVFDADQVLGFETVTFDAAWINIVELEFRVEGSAKMHFDNIVVN